MDIPFSQQSTPTGHQQQHQLPLAMRPFQPVSPLDNSGQIPFGLPMYTVAGDGRPMTVGQYLDYVLQQQADQVNAFKNDITDAVHGMRAEVQGMRQDINELIDLVKRLDTIKNKKGIKDDKKGLEDDKKGIE